MTFFGNDAASTIRDFRPLRATTYPIRDRLYSRFLRWLRPLGVSQDNDGCSFLDADFGSFLEFLIAEAGDGTLCKMLAQIPSAELPMDLWAEWENGRLKGNTVDTMIKKKLLQIKPQDELAIGIDVRLAINFFRSGTAVEVEITRIWHIDEQIMCVRFEKEPTGKRRDLSVTARITQHTITAVGAALNGIRFPSNILFAAQIEQFFAAQAAESTQAPEVMAANRPQFSANGRM